LAPYFQGLPEAYKRRMQVLLNGYQQNASEFNRPFDQELLGPILSALESLGQNDG
jgi:hypothetical protein